MNDEAFCGPRFAGLLFVGMCVLLGLSHGCASTGLYQMSDSWCEEHPEARPAKCARDHTFPMDQGHLHNDELCPSSIYRAPGGNLEQCP
jgi:hypothetical protein